jgi:hypothetical protein
MTKGNDQFTHKDGVSLKEHFNQRFLDIQRAVDKAEQTINTRLEGMNEFRETIKDQQATMGTKADIEQLGNRINKLEALSDIASGKADQESVNRANLMSIIALGIGIITFILRIFGI